MTVKKKEEVDVDKLSLAEKIAKATAEMKPVGKNGKNQAQGWRFQKESDIKAAVRIVLGNNHFAIIPCETEILNKSSEKIAKTFKGRHYQQTLTTYDVKETFELTDGHSTQQGQMVGSGSDYGDKALAKATTMALKNFEKQLFNIADKEDDPDTETTPQAQTAQKSPVRRQTRSSNNYTQQKKKRLTTAINKARIYKVEYGGSPELLTKVMKMEKDGDSQAKLFLGDWRQKDKKHQEIYDFINKVKLV